MGKLEMGELEIGKLDWGKLDWGELKMGELAIGYPSFLRHIFTLGGPAIHANPLLLLLLGQKCRQLKSLFYAVLHRYPPQIVCLQIQIIGL